MGYQIFEDVDDVYDLIRNLGDDYILGIIQGIILKDVTEEIFENKPIGWLIEL